MAKKMMLAVALSTAACVSTTAGVQSATTPGAEQATIYGAGASFPAPLYQKWFASYSKQQPGVKISYQSIGSGAGVNQFIGGTVDFAASDVAMTPDEIAKVKRGAVLIPMTAGSIVVGYNVPGIKELKLSREALSNIFLGKVKRWNDPLIAKANAQSNLPDLPITVVHRSDGSGTTAIFTKHLSAINPIWRSGPGDGKSIQWPTGIGAKGNEGVAAQLSQLKGAVGYIEYGFAKQNNISFAQLQNKSGNFVKYSPASAVEALKNVKLPQSLIAFDSDPAGAGSYPIVSYSWLLLYKHYDNPQTARALANVVQWALTQGQEASNELGYIPLPQQLANRLKPVAASIAK